jgi:hypothetical protein
MNDSHQQMTCRTKSKEKNTQNLGKDKRKNFCWDHDFLFLDRKLCTHADESGELKIGKSETETRSIYFEVPGRRLWTAHSDQMT